jgi:hypothetical protein
MYKVLLILIIFLGFPGETLSNFAGRELPGTGDVKLWQKK